MPKNASLIDLHFSTYAAVDVHATEYALTAPHWSLVSLVTVHAGRYAVAQLTQTAKPAYRRSPDSPVSAESMRAARVVKGLPTAAVAYTGKAFGVRRATTSSAHGVAETAVDVDKTQRETVDNDALLATWTKRRTQSAAAASDTSANRATKGAPEAVSAVGSYGFGTARSVLDNFTFNIDAAIAVLRRVASSTAAADHATNAVVKNVLDAVGVEDVVAVRDIPVANAGESLTTVETCGFGIARSLRMEAAVTEVCSFELSSASSSAFGDVIFGQSGFGD